MIQKISVFGAGTMGHGLAETFAMNGYPVRIYDVSEVARKNVKDAMRAELTFLSESGVITAGQVEESLERITVCDTVDYTAEGADYVIESVLEKMEVKQDLFEQLDRLCKPECILASNTSGLPLQGMMEKVSEARRARMMVCHWYNPPHLMPIVELSHFGNTSEELYEEVAQLYQKMGKQTVKVLKDVPGLVANRIQQGIARETFSIIEQGIAAPEDVDKALKYGPAFRFATTGPLEVVDMGGLDIWCTTGDNLLSVMDNRRDANPLLRKKVEEGKLGIKTGQGFYTYPPERAKEVRERFQKRLLHQLKASEFYKD